METDDFLNVAPLKEDWGGDGRGRMSLSGRCTAISSPYQPRQYQYFDTNTVPEENEWRVSGMQPDILPGKRRLLSWHEGGASTSKIVLPPSFEAPSGIFTADLEIFVLSGELQLGEWKLRKHGYSFIPAGVHIGPWKVCGNQAVELLWMENGPVSLHYKSAQNSHPDARMSEFIPALDTKILPWNKTDTIQFEVAKKKWLRKDSHGGGVWLLGVLPHYDGQYPEIQSYNEEGYCLAGHIFLGDYRFETEHFGYFPTFSTIPRQYTDDGAFFLIRVDRDLSKPGTVLSYPYSN